jgi:uncharacterized radical SAM protein YgiQ
MINEAERFLAHPDFKGRIHDVGGPTANMYGFECPKKLKKGSCPEKRCLYPEICPSMPIDHGKQIRLLRELRSLKGIKQVVVSSGLRYDMILADRKNGHNYLREVIRFHVSGQMKVAPEHCSDNVLACMGKPGSASLLEFRRLFNRLTKQYGLPQFLTYYIIAAHPGCRLQDMQELKKFARKELHLLPRQVQIFTPAPSTWSTLMYWTQQNPCTGAPCFVERNIQAREKQKQVLTAALGRKKRSLRSGGRKTRAGTGRKK